MSNIVPDAELRSIEVEAEGPPTGPAAAAASATPASPLRQRGASRSADRAYGATAEAPPDAAVSSQITIHSAPEARRVSPGKDVAAGRGSHSSNTSMDCLQVSSSPGVHGLRGPLGISPQSRMEKGRLSRQSSALQRGKITESWPGSHHIRRLFRLFDTDGNGTLSPNEFRAGLRSLGFDVSNSSSLARLHREVDRDQTGIIKESEFMNAFRTLNREAIAAKLQAAANTPATAALPHVPCSIQLIKIGHQTPSEKGAKPNSSYGINFSLEQDIPLANLAARLEEEQAEVREQSLDSSSCVAVRWLDVCGFDQDVLNLLSNVYELPHEMLGPEIELETAPHADFYAGNPQANSSAEILRTKLGSRSSSTASAISGLNSNLAPPSSATAAATAAVAAAASSSSSSAAPAAASSSESKRDDESTQTIPSEGGHSTFKLLIHSLQLMNYPLARDSSGRPTLVPRHQYMQRKPVLQSVPVHIVVANEHTLITCRPWIDPVTASQGTSSVYSAAAAAMHRALTAAHLSSSADLSSVDDEDDPNVMFTELIESLAETDSTLMGSALGLTSAKQLMLRVVEDVTVRNWAMRDQFKDWKILMSDNVADMNSGFYLTVLRDMETVANRVLRVLKPLVVTTASLCDQGDEASPLTHVKPARHNHSTLRANTLALSGANHLGSVACSDYLTPVHPQLRLLHRDLNRQLEQATLTAHLIQGLQESFVQRGRDRANDTLYLLTVVTTIVTPLQIFAGVYGMNFDNFPELHYENAYYWFWIINVAVIILIGLAFRFAKLM